MSNSFSEFEGHIFVGVLLGYLRHGELKIFLSDVDSPLSKCKHSGLGADGFTLCAGSTWHHLGNLQQIYTSHEVHFSGVNLQNINSGIFIGVRELDLSVNSTGSEEGVIEDVDSVGCHDNLDVLSCFETVQLVKKLKHCSLYLRVTLSAFNTGTTNRIDLIHEDDGRSVRSCHNEELTDHSRALTDILLYEL